MQKNLCKELLQLLLHHNHYQRAQRLHSPLLSFPMMSKKIYPKTYSAQFFSGIKIMQNTPICTASTIAAAEITYELLIKLQKFHVLLPFILQTFPCVALLLHISPKA
jgi:hypothetical protein